MERSIVVLVFIPLFALEGMEGKVVCALGDRLRRFACSLRCLFRLTVTPALSSLLLVGKRAWRFVLPLLASGIRGIDLLLGHAACESTVGTGRSSCPVSRCGGRSHRHP